MSVAVIQVFSLLYAVSNADQCVWIASARCRSSSVCNTSRRCFSCGQPRLFRVKGTYLIQNIGCLTQVFCLYGCLKVCPMFLDGIGNALPFQLRLVLAFLLCQSVWRAPVWPLEDVVLLPPILGNRDAIHLSLPSSLLPCQSLPFQLPQRTVACICQSPVPCLLSHPGLPVLYPKPADTCPRHCYRPDWSGVSPSSRPRRLPVNGPLQLLPETEPVPLDAGCSAPAFSGGGACSVLATASPVSPDSVSCSVSPGTSVVAVCCTNCLVASGP